MSRAAIALLAPVALLAACAVQPPAVAWPARSDIAPGGRAVEARVRQLPLRERERILEREILSGNVPDHLREFVPIEVATTIDGTVHRLVYRVAPDYLAIGSSRDFIRTPLRASTAQRIADRLGCMLPTRKMVDDVHRAAAVRVTPRPFHPDEHDITSFAVFARSHAAIEQERAARPGLLSGGKKDIVVTGQLASRRGRVAIFGWHRRDGQPIQPLSTVHTDSHVDYSHGIRLVQRQALLDDKTCDLFSLLGDPVLSQLISDEGPIPIPRYDTTR